MDSLAKTMAMMDITKSRGSTGLGLTIACVLINFAVVGVAFLIQRNRISSSLEEIPRTLRKLTESVKTKRQLPDGLVRWIEREVNELMGDKCSSRTIESDELLEGNIRDVEKTLRDLFNARRAGTIPSGVELPSEIKMELGIKHTSGSETHKKKKHSPPKSPTKQRKLRKKHGKKWHKGRKHPKTPKRKRRDPFYKTGFGLDSERIFGPRDPKDLDEMPKMPGPTNVQQIEAPPMPKEFEVDAKVEAPDPLNRPPDNQALVQYAPGQCETLGFETPAEPWNPIGRNAEQPVRLVEQDTPEPWNPNAQNAGQPWSQPDDWIANQQNEASPFTKAPEYTNFREPEDPNYHTLANIRSQVFEDKEASH